MKAKLLKIGGDFKQAGDLYEFARKLDLGDRSLNALSAKFQLRQNNIDEAFTLMSKFVLDQNTGELNVHDLQCMWYEIELGWAHYRRGEYRLALKQFNWVIKHFETIFQDQFDFH